ncbi:MAG: hypothetical protein CM1200mP1_08820 [Candidatus Neomarinimicrobiota bacterium]|nr:MAG: hypothetical protein CM1200mP1_08820 [Candidatus Neomarinimicrobiota bacterium]
MLGAISLVDEVMHSYLLDQSPKSRSILPIAEADAPIADCKSKFNPDNTKAVKTKTERYIKEKPGYFGQFHHNNSLPNFNWNNCSRM